MDLEFFINTVKALLPGVQYTLGLFFVTIVLSIPLGLSLAFLSAGRSRALKPVVRAYVFLMRGTPLMLQLFFIYIGEHLVLSRFTAACVAFVLNYAAYFCEIFRGGLLSIDAGQYEAAKVLGFSRFKTTVRIVMPQMFKVVLPPVSNETITLVKDTALVTAIGLVDLMQLTRARVSATSNVTPFIVAAVFYLIMSFGLTKIFDALEKRFRF